MIILILRFCESRVEVLKDMKRVHLEIDKLNESEEKAKMLLKLFEDDCKNWTSQYDKSRSLIKSYRLDALLTSTYVCYAGIFDMDTRNQVMSKWIKCLNRFNKEAPIQSSTTTTTTTKSYHGKFELKTPIQEEDSRSNIGQLTRLDEEDKTIASRYVLRDDYEFKSIVINQYDQKESIVQLNKLAAKDNHFINNALLLREYCVLPAVMNWPVVFDPENNIIKVFISN